MALNIIMHGRGAKQDRMLIGDQMNCTEDQIRMIGSLPIGEAVVRTASISRPVRVKINDPVSLYPGLASAAPVTDDEIIEHMNPIYEQNPHFKAKSDTALKSTRLKNISENLSTVRIDINCALKLYSIIRQPGFKGVLRGIRSATENGNYSLAALIFRNIIGLVSKNEQSQSFFCHHLVWLISRAKGIVSEDSLQLIVREMKQFIDIADFGHEGLDRIHQRIGANVVPRSVSYVVDNSAIETELKQAVDEAITESEALKDKKQSVGMITETLSKLDKTLLALVRTDQFSTKYAARLDAAVRGDIVPLVRLVVTFARTLDVQDVELVEVTNQLLNHARSELGSPEDDSLWRSVHGAIGDLGSEAVA
jgi:hypothetical protein